MDSSYSPQFGRSRVAIAPWVLLISLICGSISCFWGIAPLHYLLVCATAGAVWFTLLILTWRKRSPAIHFFTFMFCTGGFITLQRAFLPGTIIDSLQELSVLFITCFAPMWFLRKWVIRFARLEEKNAAPA